MIIWKLLFEEHEPCKATTLFMNLDFLFSSYKQNISCHKKAVFVSQQAFFSYFFQLK